MARGDMTPLAEPVGNSEPVAQEQGCLRLAPPPLGELLDRIDRAVADLVVGDDGREAMHAVRSGLSDICALTEENAKILRAVERMVGVSDRLADMVTDERRQRRTKARPGRLNAARQALARLDRTLASARPSSIAVSLGRCW